MQQASSRAGDLPVNKAGNNKTNQPKTPAFLGHASYGVVDKLRCHTEQEKQLLQGTPHHLPAYRTAEDQLHHSPIPSTRLPDRQSQVPEETPQKVPLEKRSG